MSTTKVSEKYMTAIVMGAVICFAFFAVSFSVVHAVENTDADAEDVSTEEMEKRAAMKKQIESLRKVIEERKGEHKEKVEEKKVEHREMVEEKKEEFRVDKAEFMTSLEGLSEEEKRAAMMEFIQNIRALIEAKKAEHKEMVEEKKEEFQEKKEERVEERDEFRSDLEGLSKEEKIAAILERVKAIKAQMESKKESEDEDETEEEREEDDESEDEVESNEV